VVRRRGLTVVEVLVASLLVAAALAPLMASIGRQARQARWARDRMMAEQLAAEVIEHLQHQGFNWMQGWGPGGTNAWIGPGATTGLLAPGGNAKRMDTVVGTQNYVVGGYPGWNNHASPNAINPAISGPDEGDPNIAGNISSGLSLDANAITNARDTFSRLGFNRRVEIFGGSLYSPGGGIPATASFMVRITVWTPDGTMQPPSGSVPDGRYQVVTFIGRR
jgi:Tfp pilus assembly protein PilV